MGNGVSASATSKDRQGEKRQSFRPRMLAVAKDAPASGVVAALVAVDCRSSFWRVLPPPLSRETGYSPPCFLQRGVRVTGKQMSPR